MNVVAVSVPEEEAPARGLVEGETVAAQPRDVEVSMLTCAVVLVPSSCGAGYRRFLHGDEPQQPTARPKAPPLPFLYCANALLSLGAAEGVGLFLPKEVLLDLKSP